MKGHFFFSLQNAYQKIHTKMNKKCILCVQSKESWNLESMNIFVRIIERILIDKITEVRYTHF